MYFPLDIPPGVYKNGTDRMAAGRWNDSNLVRWKEKALQPIGGWATRKESGTPIQVSGAARQAHIWRDDAGTAWLAIGTHTGLYVLENALNLEDVTPSGFTAGEADSTLADGYGIGVYGSGTYGTPRDVDADSATSLPATTFTLDNWGENLIAHATSDGLLYEWDPDSPSTDAAAITNAPTGNRSFVITGERFIMALGAGGNPRLVQWCDQEDNTDWTPSATNQAGDLELQTNGQLICGRRIPGGVLLWTTEDAWVGSYQGPPFVYGFQLAAGKCSIASAMADVSIDSRVAWMGLNGFWIYNGYVQPLPSDVGDYVYGSINRNQISKTWGMADHERSEATWYYPSEASNEIDSYVTWNWRDNVWWVGRLVRLCGVPAGILPDPIMVDDEGSLFNHEFGFDYDGDLPYVESAPCEIDDGGRVISARQFIPDEKTAGDVRVSFKARPFPNGAETTYGPYDITSPTFLRFQARQVKVRITGKTLNSWRYGRGRLEGVPGGLR